MSVYVGPAEWPFGRMVMCHMLADTHEELVAMATKIDVQQKWIQRLRRGVEHFDICKAKRALAVQNGAIEVTRRGEAEIAGAKAKEITP